MFYLLSKTVYTLAMPLTWIIILLLWALISTKKRKKLIVYVILILYIFANPWVSNNMMLLWEKAPTPFERIQKNQYEVGIVLSGVTNSWKSPHDRVYFNHGADRVLHAVRLYKEGKIRRIMVTGSFTKINGEKHSEAQDMKQVMMRCGVRERHIYLEDESRNTHESALQAARILHTMHPQKNKKYLLITSGFHLRRALGCFEDTGLKVDGFGADYYTSDSDEMLWNDMFIPNVAAFQTNSKLIHEIVGYIVYFFMGYM